MLEEQSIFNNQNQILDASLIQPSSNSLDPSQRDYTEFSSDQMMHSAAETPIDVEKNQGDAKPALVYANESIFNPDFTSNAEIAFGESSDIQKAQALGYDTLTGQSGVLPNIDRSNPIWVTTETNPDVTNTSKQWNLSFINRNDTNYASVDEYDFSNPVATVNLGWQNGFVYESTPFETLTVDSRKNVAAIGQPKVYSSVLEAGVRYHIEASGTWQYWTDKSPNYIADARFQTGDAWNTKSNGPGGLHSDVLSNGNDDIWGEYQPNHVYTYEIVGNGQRVDFYVNDGDYLNNQGAYTVKIYRQSATQTTDNTIRLNANFGELNPAPNVQRDNFVMQAWTTTKLEAGKSYQVTTQSDDGTRFFVKNIATDEITYIGADWRNRGLHEPAKKSFFNVSQTGDYEFYIQGYDHSGASAFNVELKEISDNALPNHTGLIKDINKDGKHDILWRNYINGETHLWSMDGGTRLGAVEIPDYLDMAWHPVAMADFNNDDNLDIVWRYHWLNNTGHNRIWLMHGNTRISEVGIERVEDNNWHIVGTGDFNLDGNADILWRNYASGENVIWNMKDTSRDNSITLEKQTDLNQRIVGTGDFNGDAKSDILWRNAATGQLNIWFMDGTTKSSVQTISSSLDLNWSVAGTGDMNNDGKSDIIWRNLATGGNTTWLMNGATKSGDLEIQDVPERNWNIVGDSDIIPIWKAEYFGNKDLAGTPIHTDSFTNVTGNITQNWGLDAPPNIPVDQFSARYKTQQYLNPGIYKINLNSDDGVRVWINNDLIIDRWVDQAGTYSDYFSSSGGYYPVTIEYKENMGVASLNYEIVKHQPYNNFGNPDGIVNSWKATFYNWNGQGNPIIDDNHKIGTVNLGGNIRSDGRWGMNAQNWGTGSPAPEVPTDFFAMHAYTRVDLTAGHTYKVRLRSDDGYRMWAHKLDGNPFDITENALGGTFLSDAYGVKEFTFIAPESGTFDFHTQMFESGGDAIFDLSVTDLTTPPPSVWENPLAPGSYSITSRFGLRDLNNDGIFENHKGIDLGANTGTRIEAARSGTVTFVGTDQYGGKYVDIDHGGGLKTRYLHLSTFAVSKGDVVNDDTKIGEVGSTGLSTGPHLHFEVWENGERKNPEDYILFNVSAGSSTSSSANVSTGESIFDYGGKSYQWTKYTIRSGDSLSAIAQRTLGDANGYNFIAQRNDISNPNNINAGEVIDVPQLFNNSNPSTPVVSGFLSTSTEGLEFIGQHEGLRLNLYNDPAGHTTIGYGHLVHYGAIDGSEPEEFKQGITKERALQLLAEDAANAAQAVKDLVTVSLNQAQFDALVSFTFNLGRGHLQSSDLLERLNNGEYSAVPYELSRWVYGGGVVLPGLVRRREEEGILFSNGIYTGIG